MFAEVNFVKFPRSGAKRQRQASIDAAQAILGEHQASCCSCATGCGSPTGCELLRSLVSRARGLFSLSQFLLEKQDMQGEKARWVWNRQSTAVRSFRLSGRSVGSGGLLHLYRSIPVYVDSEIGAKRRSRRLRAAAAEQKALPSGALSLLVWLQLSRNVLRWRRLSRVNFRCLWLCLAAVVSAVLVGCS